MTRVTQDSLKGGEIVGERYRVLGLLGSGGMGNVYRVEHTLMAKEMAMKLLRPELSSIPEVVERFEREAKSASRLDNQHIVRVTDFGQATNGSFFLVMELLAGESLAQKMGRGPIAVPEVLEIGDQILVALEHAHANGVVHRDLKPENVMLVEREGRQVVKILDFGLAKLTPTREGHATPKGTDREPTLTQAGVIFGTPRYMAPEQAVGEPVDERTDLYAVGVVLYECLAGRPMFQASAAIDVLTCHLTKAPPPLDLRLEDRAFATEVERVVLRAVQKHKQERYQSATEFRAALAGLAEVVRAKAPAGSGGAGAADGSGRRSPLPRAASGPVTVTDGGVADTHVPGARRSSSVSDASELAARPRRWPIFLAVLVVLGAIATSIGFALSRSGSPILREQPPLSRAEAAIARGDLPAARAILGSLATKDDKDPRVQILLGHISFAEGDFAAAIAEYKRGLELDGTSAHDPVLLGNAKRLVEKNAKLAGPLVTALAIYADQAAAGTLAEIAESAPTQRMRSHAYQGLERLGETGRLDVVAYLGGELEKVSTRSCKTRKWYVERLIASDDPRMLPILIRERNRRGGLFNLENFNGCMAQELNAQIAKLEEKARAR